MVRSSIMIGSAVAALTAAAWQGQGQQGFPRPTLDTGPVRVEGSVSVTNTPTVRAEQAGIWNVSALPPVEFVTPEFVQPGHLYSLTSTDGRRVAIRVVEVKRGGWVRASEYGTERPARVWYNLSQFQTVEESGSAK